MKINAITTGLGALALASAQPALAQAVAQEPEPTTTIGGSEAAEGGSAEDSMGMLGMAMLGAMIATMFEPEPLEADAQARLPQAQSVAGTLIPEGVYGTMMSQLVDSFTGPIFALADVGGGMDGEDLAKYTGLEKEQTDALSQEERNELTEIFDPVYETRASATIDMVSGMLNQVFLALEPGMREGLARAYAGRFSASELAELEAFFATPTGAKYAAESLPAYTDPQVISGLMQSMPALMTQLPAMVEQLEAAEDGLPEPRRYDDLTPSEQRRASALLGVDQMTLRERMAAADAQAAIEAEVAEEAAFDTEVMLEADPDPYEETTAEVDAMADDSGAGMEDFEETEDVETGVTADSMEEATEEVGG